MDRKSWAGRACAARAVEKWIQEVELVIEVLVGPEASECGSVLARSLDRVIHAVSDRSGYAERMGTSEVATVFDVSERTVQEWFREGKVQARKIDGEWMADEWALIDICFGHPRPWVPPAQRDDGTHGRFGRPGRSGYSWAAIARSDGGS